MNELDMDFRLSEIERQLSNLRGKLQSDLNPLLEYYMDDVREIVPTLNSGASPQQTYIPSDRYYALIGPVTAAGDLPTLFAGLSSVTLTQWDTTAKKFYARLTGAGDCYIGPTGKYNVIYPAGPFGTATSYAPKNSDSTTVSVKFTARFNANADYTVYGIGAHDDAATNSSFDDSATPFFQVLRNAGNWELGSCDGSTISQSSAAGADGSLHEFEVKWNATTLRLYVDDSLVITKTTNMPIVPLRPQVWSNGSTNTIDIVDYLISWEVA